MSNLFTKSEQAAEKIIKEILTVGYEATKHILAEEYEQIKEALKLPEFDSSALETAIKNLTVAKLALATEFGSEYCKIKKEVNELMTKHYGAAEELTEELDYIHEGIIATTKEIDFFNSEKQKYDTLALKAKKSINAQLGSDLDDLVNNFNQLVLLPGIINANQKQLSVLSSANEPINTYIAGISLKAQILNCITTASRNYGEKPESNTELKIELAKDLIDALSRPVQAELAYEHKIAFAEKVCKEIAQEKMSVYEMVKYSYKLDEMLEQGIDFLAAVSKANVYSHRIKELAKDVKKTYPVMSEEELLDEANASYLVETFDELTKNPLWDRFYHSFRAAAEEARGSIKVLEQSSEQSDESEDDSDKKAYDYSQGIPVFIEYFVGFMHEENRERMIGTPKTSEEEMDRIIDKLGREHIVNKFIGADGRPIYAESQYNPDEIAPKDWNPIRPRAAFGIIGDESNGTKRAVKPEEPLYAAGTAGKAEKGQKKGWFFGLL